MKIHLLAVGKQMPHWINAGYQEYAKRFPATCPLILHEIALAKRGKNVDIDKLVQQEGIALCSSIPKGSHVVALDVAGVSYNTEELAKQVQRWRELGRPISLLIGGPDGLSSACREQAHQHWSLSPLTLPHPLVRLIVVEQLYRSLMILQGHPYHR